MNSLVVLWTTIVSMGVFRSVESALDQVVPQSKSTWPPASLTFVMDTTGSMHDDLAQVKDAVNVIFDSVIANPDVPVQNFVLVPFHDPDVGSATVTRSKEEFQSALDYLYIDGGGDCEEMTLSGIKKALEKSLPRSYIFVFTDASAKDYDLFDEVAGLVQLTGSQIIFVLTGDCGYTDSIEYQVYQRIAILSKGKIFQLQKIDVKDILVKFNFLIEARLVSLVYRVDVPAGNSRFDFAVDECLQSIFATVTTKGSHDEVLLNVNAPSVRLVSPNGRERYSTVIDTKSVLVVNESNPKPPGPWQMFVQSNLSYSIIVDGRSFCNFKTSFVYATTPGVYFIQPVINEAGNIVLNATAAPVSDLEDVGNDCYCTGAHVSQIDFLESNGEETGMSVRLDWNVSEPFPVLKEHTMSFPNRSFILRVLGRDEYGYAFQRLSSTIAPGKIDKPKPVEPESVVFWALRNDSFVLPCDYHSTVSVTVEWYKGGKILLRDDDRYDRFSDGRLLIRRMTDDDVGMYRCELRSVLTVPGFDLHLNIAEIPTVTLVPGALAVRQGGTARFTCFAVGPPTPKLWWYINGVAYSYSMSRRYRVVYHQMPATFEIRGASRVDEGTITCQASNLAGTVNKTGLFGIEAPPRIAIFPPEITVVKNANATFVCRGDSLPRPVLNWYRNGVVLAGVVTSDREVKLTINFATLNDQGAYTCVGVNSRGREEVSALLIVQTLPFFLVEPQDAVVLSGNSVSLDCVADGTPLPSIAWYKDGLELPLLTDAQRLFITNVQPQDSGSYICVATNVVGSRRASANVKVIAAPTIEPMPRVVHRPVSLCVSLHCQADGSPTPTLSWKYDGSQVLQRLPKRRLHANGTLQICDLAERDAGTYECNATNVGGTAYASTRLDVQYGPVLDRRLSNKWATTGTSALFVCTVAKANPTALISWEKNGISISGKTGNELRVDDVVSDDDGDYTCRAENSIGSDFSSARLYVVDPPTVFRASSVAAVRGQSARLNCTVSGFPRPRITWTRNGRPIVGVTTKYAVGSIGDTLEINNVQLDDAGSYDCFAVNRGGNDTGSATLDVLYSPSIVNISSSVETLVNTSVTLTCIGSGNPAPRVRWYKQGVNIARGIENGRGLTLDISSVQTTDAGFYRCTAKNEVGEDQARTKISVLVAPYEISGPRRVTVVEGSPTFLHCPIAGIPRPTVTWRFGNTSISHLTPRYRIFNNGTLRIRKSRIEDDGSYRCEGSNIAGSATTEVYLNVQYSPVLETSPSDQRVVLGRGCTHFECSARGNPPPIVTWRKDARLLQISDGFHVSPNGTILTVCPIQLEIAGTITCRAANIIGRRKATAVLDVIDESRIVSEIDEVIGVVQRTALLPCTVTGYPRPTVSWSVNGTTIVNGTRHQTLSNGTLKVSDLTRLDDGVYVCTATNDGGDDTTKINLIIHYGPSIVLRPENRVVVAGEDVSFSCRFHSKPASFIRWIKGVAAPLTTNPNVAISNGGETLTLTDVRGSDAGEYSCIGENYVDRAVASATLRVIEPPRIVCEQNSANSVLHRFALLRCTATGLPHPKIDWWKDGRRIDAISLKTRIYANGTLRIENVQIGDAGDYVLVVTNDGGVANETVFLNVQYGPTITESPRSLEALAGTDVSFRCNATGNPSPTVTWTKDGESIEVSSRRLFLTANDRLLTLNDIRSSDDGLYACTARNSFRFENQVFQQTDTSLPARLSVLFAPVWIGEAPLVFVVDEGNGVSLPCNVSGNPTPNIRWLREGRDLVSLDYRVLRSSGSLFVRRTRREHAGVYTCMASNRIGSLTTDIILDVRYKPSIVQMSSDKTVIADQSFELMCRGDGNPMPDVLWEFSGDRMTNSMPGITANTTNDTAMVKIDSAQVDDAGWYTCRVVNELGQGHDSIMVRVIEPPAFVSTVSRVSAPVDAVALLPCNAVGTPSPDYEWTTSDGDLQTFTFSNGTLRIANVQRSDAGFYRCRASNEGGFIQTIVELDVQYSPKIVDVSNGASVLVNESISFICNATGNPLPTIAWTHVRSSTTKTLLSATRTVLTFDVVKPTDAGSYVCSARNYLGQDAAALRLFVVEPPSLIRRVGIVTTRRGNVARLPCDVVGNPPPTVQWFDGSIDVAGLLDRHEILQNRSLRISRVDLGDAGSFMCVATNEGGSIRVNVTLDVQYLPSILSLSPEQTVVEGSEAIILCRALGNPEPIVRWEFEGKRLDNSGRLSVGSLSFFNVSSSRRGAYTCVAENVVGAARRTTQLRVIEIPRIVQIDHGIVVDENTTVWLPCTATGFPKPTIRWWKNGRSIDEAGERFQVFDNGTLRIDRTKAIDDSIYRCTAQNEGGRISAITNVTVLYGPYLTVSHRSVVVWRGANLTFTCQASGHPRPQVDWYRGSERLSSSLTRDLTASLSLNRVTVVDEGRYLCVGSSDRGEKDLAVDLQVLVAPYFVTKPSDRMAVAKESVTLRCSAGGNPMPTIQWKRNGVDIIPDSNTSVSADGLTLKNVGVESEGLYVCIARNVAGEERASAVLTVVVLPTIRRPVTPLVSEKIDRCILLDCEAAGYPLPVVSWRYNGSIIADRLPNQIFSNGTLKRCDLAEKDAGSYTCVASNVGGKDQIQIDVDVQFRPALAKSLTDQWILVNTSVTFTCQVVKANPPASLSWLKDGMVISENASEQLHIARVQTGDSGRYECIAENKIGRDNSSARLDVIVPPRIEPTASKVIVLRGNTALLDCVVDGFPPPLVHWFRGEEKISGTTKYAAMANGTLRIHNAQTDDVGDYRCTVVNRGGNATKIVFLDVYYSPSVATISEGQIALVNTSVGLACTGNGNPSPTVKWMKNGVEVSANSKLQIDSLVPSDTGAYVCVVQNVVGSSRQSVSLKVIVLPRISPPSRTVSIIVGNVVLLRCSAHGIPEPVIDWRRSGTALVSDGLKRTIRSNGTLQINNVQVDDDGAYTCHASNDAGLDDAVRHLDVQYQPVITKRPEAQSVIVGSCAGFECSGIGNPSPVAYWERNGLRLSNGNNATHLAVCPAQVVDSGIYTCVLENSVGRTTASANLQVIVPSSIGNATTVVNGTVNGSAWLPCNATGIPPPVISWYRNGMLINAPSAKYHRFANGTLRISNLVKDDEDEYVCRAVNEGGTNEKKVILNVHYSPSIVSPPMDRAVIVTTNIVFRCNVSSHPVATIAWLKDDAPLPSNSARVFTSQGGEKLHVDDVRPNDAGLYTCVAENYVGRANESATLRVIVPARITSTVEIVEAIRYRKAFLPCASQGLPSPTTTWHRFGKEVVRDDVELLPDGTLRIDNLVTGDRGDYECVVTNEGGNDTKTVRLDVQYGPSVIVAPSWQEVVADKNAVFVCNVSSNPSSTLSWSRLNGKIISGGDGGDSRFELSDGNSVLTINDVRSNDSGMYVCSAKNTMTNNRDLVTMETNSSAALEVIVPPRFVSIVSVVDVLLGNRALIPCDVAGIPRPQIEWLRFGETVSSPRYQILENGTLLINAAQLDDSGTFTCLASNKGGNASIEVVLDVQYAPSIWNISTNQSILVGNAITVDCSAVGNPTPAVSWLFQGTEIRRGGRLTLSNFQPSNAGEYECTAENVHGFDESLLKIDVIVPPSFVDVVAIVHVHENMTAVLPCSVRGIPTPQVFWHKANKIIRNSLHRRQLSNGSLQVRNAARSDSGIYVCVAENVGGRISRSLTLDVQYGPTITRISEDQTAIVGTSVRLECVAEGNPIPSLFWEFNGSRLVNDSIGTVSRAELSSAGRYSCVAENLVSESRQSTNLFVIDPPSFVREVRTVITKEGDLTILPCEVTGFPRPVVEWRSKGGIVTSSPRREVLANDSLRIRNVSIGDAGIYECTATNEGGFVKTDINLDVQYAPELSGNLFDQWILVGTTVAFDCQVDRANPMPSVSWRKDGQLLRSVLGNRLIINNVNTSDEGTYACTAENVVGSSSLAATLRVVVPPSIDPSPSLVVVLRGEAALMHCVAFGAPLPTVRWFKVGQEAELGVASTKYEKFDNGTLKVKNSQLDDRGDFRCAAANRGGRSATVTTLDVHYFPSVVNISDNVVSLINSNIFLSCQGRGSPDPTVKWTRNGSELSVGSFLLLRSVQPDDTGNYTCSVENLLGTSTKSVTVTVIVPPRVLKPQEYNAVIIGNSVWLHCEASGIPQPTVEWYRSNRRLVSDGGKYQLESNDSIKIVNAQVDDSGTYSCGALNIAGVDNGTRSLDVQYGPRMTVVPQSQSIIVNRCVVFQCSGEGNPRPIVYWERSGRRLFSGGNLLISPSGTEMNICPTTVADSGSYDCIVKNKIGHKKVAAVLKVIVPSNIDNRTVVVNGTLNGIAFLPCNATGVPPPVISWFKEDAVIDISSPKYHQFPNGTLKVFNLATDDEDLYRCLAVNDGGETERNVTLNVHYAPSILTPLRNLTILASKDVVFHCVVSAHPEANIKWMKNNVVLPSNSTRVFTSKEATRLHVDDARPVDTGTYRCVAENYVGQASESAMLRVIVPARITTIADRVTAIRDQEGFLPCTSEGIPSPTTRWYRNGDELAADDVELLPDGTLRIGTVETADKGDYTCIVSNEGGNDSRMIQLDVHFGPSVTVSPPSQEAIADSDVIVNCNVSGNPTPSVSWSITDGSSLLSNSRFDVTDDGKTLTIFDVRSSDTGEYVCTAQNSVSNTRESFVMTDKASSFLDVIVPPAPNGTASVVTVTLGDPVQIPCKAFGIPPPAFEWYRANEKVADVGTLKWTAANLSDAGRYSCNATNKGGTLIQNVTLNVLYAPSITEISGNLSVIVGSSFTLNCRADGNPHPTVSWEFRDSRLATTNGVVTVQRARPSDAGLYTCIVQNAVSRTTETISVRIIEPPTFVSEVDRVSVRIYDNASLPCIVDGNPRPSIRWAAPADQSMLRISSDNSLLVRQAVIGDSGVYECIAENEGGSISTEIYLDVQYAFLVNLTSNTSAMVNTVAQFICTGKGNPQPHVNWFKNGLNIKNGSSLLFSPVQPSDAGVYTCVIENGVARDSDSTRLDVIVPAIVNEPDTKIAVRQSSNIVLPCTALGTPLPTLEWFRKSSRIEQSTPRHVLYANGSLHIVDVQLNDDGGYECIATNEGGKDQRNVTLDVQFGPIITEGPTSKETIGGNNVIFRCMVDGNPRPTVQWEKDGIALPISGGLSVSAGGQLLSVYAVQLSDAGNYTCVAEDVVTGQKVRAFAYLDVYVPPSISPSRLFVVKRLGEPAWIPCNATGVPRPEISWSRDGETVENDGNYVVLKNGTLVVRSSNVSDQGSFVCTATNIGGNASMHADLDVQYAPIIFSKPQRKSVPFGTVVTFSCRARGDPLPTILWRHKLQEEDYAENIIDDGHESVYANLSFTATKGEQIGDYLCAARNRFARVSQIHSLVIVGGDPPQILQPRIRVVVIKGGTALLPCRTSGYVTHTHWEFDDRIVKIKAGRLEIFENKTLALQNVRQGDNGTHTCVVGNPWGESNAYVDLLVVKPPKVRVSPQKTTAVEGDTLRMQCVVEGEGYPMKISWTKRNTELTNSNRNKIVLERIGNSLTLTFGEIRLKDAGKYECVAQNLAGTDDAVARIQVDVPPKIVSSYKFVNGTEKKALMLPCEAVGTPQPEISWSVPSNHSGRFTTFDNGSLLIDPLSRNDSGSFRCVARNRAGVVSETTNVNVFYKPKIVYFPREISASVSEDVNITCDAIGNPDPEIQVREPFYSRVEGGGTITITPIPNGVSIGNVQYSIIGLYFCVAHNDIGQDRAVGHLSVT